MFISSINKQYAKRILECNSNKTSDDNTTYCISGTNINILE